jgi:hypothetical protein
MLKLITFAFCGAFLVHAADFETEVLPILKAHCVTCHSGPVPQAGLDLHTQELVLKGGRSGPAVQPGVSDRSLLIEKVVSKSMPPVGAKLTDLQISVLRHWIDSLKGAPRQVTESDALPIFQMRCVVCHGKRKQEGGLDLRTQASRFKGGVSGPAIVPGHPEQSVLSKRVTSGEMPPPKLWEEYFVRPPSETEVETLRQWIANGAPPSPPTAPEPLDDPLVKDKDRSFWSFQPPKKPSVPSVSHTALVQNAVDSFLLQKLESKGLSYSPPASKNILLRRVFLDVIGLPPTPAETEAFLNDRRPDAYERLIDTLLASPRYGERWAKFWLDAAGYSDSEGLIDEDLVRPNNWRYRDYVIRSLNQDKPYNQFLTEQIAGDELVNFKAMKQATPELMDKLIGTGFLRQVSDGTYSPANGSIPERMNVIADEIEVLSTSVMGLTIGCARCHNHKYDPLPQRDYYRLSAILQTAYDPYDWVKPTERNLEVALESERKQVADFNRPIEGDIKRLEAALDERAKPFRKKLLDERVAALPDVLRADVKTLAETPADKRTATQKYLADKFEETLKITIDDLAKKYPEFRADSTELRKSIADAKRTLRPKPEIRALYEMGGEPSPAYLLRRGDAQQIGDRVTPGVPSVLRTGLAPYHPEPPYESASGNRLAFARWLTQPSHPLTARVIVNRLWMHHFGRGIVASASNFGRMGTPPSHPELLDWLATELVSRGWSLKQIHRLTLTSNAYRQGSALTPELTAADPDNVLLSRMPLRRMDAEQLHDSILAASGELDLKEFGRAVQVEPKPAGDIVDEGSNRTGWRRAIYTLQRRTQPVTLLEAFDLPPMSPNCIARSYSTVSIQALQMTNSAFVRDRARYLAGRLLDEYPQPEKRISQLYVRALSRLPAPDETRAALRDIQDLTTKWAAHLRDLKTDAPHAATAEWYALADFCHAILASAEFTYLD